MRFIPSKTRHCQIGPFLAPMGDSDPYIQLNKREIQTLEGARKILCELSGLCHKHVNHPASVPHLESMEMESTGAENRIENIITDTKGGAE